MPSRDTQMSKPKSMLQLLLLPILLARFVSAAAPTIRLGKTTLTGRTIDSFGQEFFGG
jgi:hypothetical protein